MRSKKRYLILFITLSILLFGKNSLVSEAKEKDSKIETVTNDMGSLLKNIEASDMKRLLSFAREQIEKGNWETEEGIDRAIAEGEKEFKITLTKQEKKKIHEIVKKIKELKLAPEFILEQAEKIYNKYGEELTQNATDAGNKILEETKEKIQEEVKKSVKDYFSNMVGKVKVFFKDFFGN